jgi:AcrR family transcriptional regulator
MAADNKQDKMSLLAEKTLELVDLHGLEAVTFSRVSQLTNISRPWIYKYIGNKKDDLLEFAINHFGRIFAALEDRATPLNEGDWLSSINLRFEHLMSISDQYPWAISIYMHYRGTSTPLGKRIEQIEAEHRRISFLEMKNSLKLSESDIYNCIDAMRAIRMGLVHHYCTDKSKELIRRSFKDFFAKICIDLIKRDPR